MAKTQHRSVRVPDSRWDAAEQNAAALGTNRACWINEALAWLNGEPGSKRPKRPTVSDAPPS